MRSYAARCINRSIDYDIYKEYMDSQDWRDLSYRLKEERGSCAVCGSKEQLQCHHKRYDFIMTKFEERQIQVLCRDHHREVHGLGTIST